MRTIKPTDGPCLWCGEYVTDSRVGFSTLPDWEAEGDFGCDASPETSEEGVGSHARPSDAARWLRRALEADGFPPSDANCVTPATTSDTRPDEAR